MSRRADLTRARSPRRSPPNVVPGMRRGTWAAETPPLLKELARRSAILIDVSEAARIPPTTAARSDGARRARLLFLAELAAFVVLLGIDEVMAGRLGLNQAGRPLSTTVVLVILVLTVLRRRFPRRLSLLTASVIGLSLAHSLVAELSRLGALHIPVGLSITEIVATGIMVSAVARRGTGWGAAVLVALGAAAMTAAPFARTGGGVDVKTFAAPGALIWGTATAFGLVLRDADGRRTQALLDARRAERMHLARELHDLVTHHVTGIVVRAQAAQMVAARRPDRADVGQGYGQIEQAATASLTAMRELVGVLRSDAPARPRATAIRQALEEAVRDDPRATIDLSTEAEQLDPGPDVAATLHWIVLEALTNVRRHAGGATRITIGVRVEPGPRPALVLDVTNNGVTADPGTPDTEAHYGLTGMRERLAALGGALAVGPEPEHGWQVTARVPIDDRRRPVDEPIEAI
jgi:signal transduction histidine kinase